MQRHRLVELFQDPGDHSGKDDGELTLPKETPNLLSFQPDSHSFDSAHRDTTGTTQVSQTSLGALGPHVISIKGGEPRQTGQVHWTKGNKRMQNVYGSTTECILQNLSTKIGNPSMRRYANAPWRAFAWTCALLQETNTQPWGNLQDAVQESLELAEEIDIRKLPGLQRLWKKHDLNAQGDANHFVNSLWNLSQTRAFHYRYAEIR